MQIPQTPTIPPSPQDIINMLRGLQDMSLATAEQCIKSHNGAMDILFIFRPMVEIDMGSALPPVKIPQSLAPFLETFHDKALRFLP